MEYSPFYELPAELRIRIYELTLISPDSIKVQLAGVDLVLPSIEPCHRNKQLLTLTNTCRQIKQEAMPVFLAENKFTLVLYPDLEVGDNRSLLTDLATMLSRLTLSSTQHTPLSERLEIQFGWMEMEHQADLMYTFVMQVKDLLSSKNLTPGLRLLVKMFAHPVCEEVEHFIDPRCNTGDAMWEGMTTTLKPCVAACKELADAKIASVWTGRLGRILRHRKGALEEFLRLMEGNRSEEERRRNHDWLMQTSR